jgi:hypothetical protein
MSIKGRVRSLFRPKTEGNPHKRFPDEYYERYYVSKPMAAGIKLVASADKISKKRAIHLLLVEGFKVYSGDKARQDIEARTAARELNQQIKVSKFIIELEKFCREQGIDISKAVEFLET